MNIAGSVAFVTGGASGIGKGMCERFAALGADHVVAADLDVEGAEAVASAIGGSAVHCDVTDDASMRAAVDATIDTHGRIDLFCANAGVGQGGGLDVADDLWDLSWQVNVMGPVRGARAVIPHMIANDGGTILITASSAGLTTGPTSLNYATSKHAVIGVAEWIALNHGPTIKVSALCPNIVDTPMAPVFGLAMAEPMSVDEVIDATVAGLAADTFLITPTPAAAEIFRRKADDYDGFIAAMQERLAAMRG